MILYFDNNLLNFLFKDGVDGQKYSNKVLLNEAGKSWMLKNAPE